MATECYCIVVENDEMNTNLTSVDNALKLASLGHYFVEWRRTDNSELNEDDNNDDEENDQNLNENIDWLNVLTKTVLPELNVESFPFIVETKLPSFGCLDQQLELTYKIKNKCYSQILDVECTLDENEYFSIAGKKLVKFFLKKHELIKDVI